MIPSPLLSMAVYKQFMLYKLKWNDLAGKYDKLPYDWESCRIVNSHDSRYWMDYDTAEMLANAYGAEYGVAFVFHKDDPFFFVDLDNCLVDGKWDEMSQEICSIFAGAAIEISVSGKGLHIFGSYDSCPDHKCQILDTAHDFFTAGRFVALTGIGIIGDCSKDFTEILPGFIEKYCPVDDAIGCDGWTTEPCEGYGNALLNDDDLISKALSTRSMSAFDGKPTFKDLWERNVEVLSRTWPDDHGKREYDYSQADSALAQHLAFWTGKNCERIHNLMMRSALVREKWNRLDYLQRTILGVVNRQSEVYSVNKQVVPHHGNVKPLPTNPFCTAEEMVKRFAGCVYIRDLHMIMLQTGEVLTQDRFNAEFGGGRYILDSGNTKTTNKAWDAYLYCEVYKFPQVQTPAFKPMMKPGEIYELGGITYVNTYFPVNVPCEEGDVSPLLNHLKLILPNERDRTIFISYMAACIQYKGVKFRWAPLLQGVQGNGKTLFTLCVAAAIGKKYTHKPEADKLGNQFNSWMKDKLFYGVEDVYDSKLKWEIWNNLKPMITGEDVEIEGKGADQYMSDICGNFIFNSNYKEALPKTNDDRRLAIFFTAQQFVEDLARDGMSGDYFPNLYEWCRECGYARFTHYLMSYDIPDEFNPATKCHRAPQTSSTLEAINSNRSNVEQEMLEAIANETPGFIGDWISLTMLDKYLINNNISRVKMSISTKIKILNSIGYVLHPGLIEGRTPSIVMPDAARTRLFILKSSEYYTLTDPIEIMDTYSRLNSL